jgi:hypothetical protein
MTVFDSRKNAFLLTIFLKKTSIKPKKVPTGPVKKYLFRPAGIPAGQEFSTGPDRAGPAGCRYRLQL